MSGFVGILVSDPWLHNQFTQVELRSLKSHVRISVPIHWIIIITKTPCESFDFLIDFVDLILINSVTVHEHEEGERKAYGVRPRAEDGEIKGGWRSEPHH